MRMFNTEGVLLVDASNTFNALSTVLLNIQHLYLSITTILSSCCNSPSELFIDGSVLLSTEETTQGDPLALFMYALATVCMTDKPCSVHNIIQAGYADDVSASGCLKAIHMWWDLLTE